MRNTKSPILDTLTFGDTTSEAAHHLSGTGSEAITGGLGELARRLLPQPTPTWEGGTVAFTLTVDPEKQNYVTVRLWGDDQSPDRLTLFIDGKQVGYRHESDIEPLDFGTEDRPYNGRFYYRTSPLPLSLTRGKTTIACEIRSSGRLWSYGKTFDKYQQVMTEPTRGIYRLYTHTDGYFAPPKDEKQGSAPAAVPVRSSPGPEVLVALKTRVNTEIDGLLKSGKPLNQMQIQFLAKAYHVSWTDAYQKPQNVQRIIDSLDSLFLAYRKNPKLAEFDPATWNPDWFGFGPSGHAIALLALQITPKLSEQIPDESGAKLTRRAAYTELLRAGQDWLRTHRRQYTNQSMIVDLNIAASNRGLQVVAPEKALPEARVSEFLYQSVGRNPWLGSDTPSGPAKPLGESYYQLTDKGLTKELGYVGYYGEVLDWVCQIYDVTRPTYAAPGDPKIKDQLVKMAKARSIFRFPTVDAEGNRAMRIETVVGWRDAHYPGDVTYVQRPGREGSAIQTAVTTLDPVLLGFAAQMIDDNQFFASVQHQMQESGLRVTIGLLETPDQYARILAQRAATSHLPMTTGQPDFVFSDEEDGVVAVKNGQDILYVSLYWRALFGINNLARVHYMSPVFDRIAVVHQESEFVPSGNVYKRPEDVNSMGVPWLPKYPPTLKSAHTGEELPIPKIPDGIAYKPGDRSPYAGKADFYQLQYGPYLIGMNTTKDKSYTLRLTDGFVAAQNLTSHKPLSSKREKSVTVGPRSTVVLYVTK